MSSIVTHTLMILGQGPATAPAGGAAPGWGGLLTSPMFPLILVLGVFWFFMMTSKRKQDRQRQQTLDALKRGDRIQTIGGVLGTVVEVRDTEVVVKVDEGNNTKIKFTRAAVAKVVTEEDKSAEK